MTWTANMFSHETTGIFLMFTEFSRSMFLICFFHDFCTCLNFVFVETIQKIPIFHPETQFPSSFLEVMIGDEVMTYPWVHPWGGWGSTRGSSSRAFLYCWCAFLWWFGSGISCDFHHLMGGMRTTHPFSVIRWKIWRNLGAVKQNELFFRLTTNEFRDWKRLLKGLTKQPNNKKTSTAASSPELKAGIFEFSLVFF